MDRKRSMDKASIRLHVGLIVLVLSVVIVVIDSVIYNDLISHEIVNITKQLPGIR
jgi:hypothetical protein